MNMRSRFLTTVLMLLLSVVAVAQAIDTAGVQPIPQRYIETVTAKAAGIEQQLDKKTAKALAGLKKQEEKIIRRLSKLDSSKAKELAATAKAKYAQLEEKLRNPGKLMNYIPGLDSMGTSLQLLNNITGINTSKEKIQQALAQVDGLKAQLQKAESIKAFLKERKEYLKEQNINVR